VRHSSYDAISGDDLLALGTVSLAGELVLFQGLIAGFEAGYGGGRVKDKLFEEYPTETTIHSLEVGPWVGYRFWDALMPYARLGFVGTWCELQLTEESTSMTADSFAPGFYASGGLELSIPRRWMAGVFQSRVATFGIRFEAGYAYFGELAFEDRLSKADISERHRSALGSLTLRGASLRTSLVISF
jgi:hypothetical protein